MNSDEAGNTHGVLNVEGHVVETDLANGGVALVDGELSWNQWIVKSTNIVNLDDH